MNIYDIARLSGVSIATVSRVVNDSPLVSEKTKAKVRRVMEENNYVPNVFARGLGLGTMKTVGIICPDVVDTYMATAVAFLEMRFREAGYDCILQCSGRNPSEAQKAVANILNKQIDALFLIGSFYCMDGGDTPRAEYVREAARKVPVFMINGWVSGDNIFCTLCDDRYSAYLGVQLLIREGRKNILFLCNSDSYSSRQKRQGYTDALTEAGLPVYESGISLARTGVEDIRRELLAWHDRRVDGIFAATDRLAAGALKYARDAGIAVPDDLGIVGYNNSELAVICSPELTSVDSMCETLCRISLDSMMSLLDGEKPESKTYVKGILVRRGSTLL